MVSSGSHSSRAPSARSSRCSPGTLKRPATRNAAAVPDGIKSWIKLHVGALYRNREAFSQGVSVAELPNRFTDSLLDPWRLTVV